MANFEHDAEKALGQDAPFAAKEKVGTRVAFADDVETVPSPPPAPLQHTTSGGDTKKVGLSLLKTNESLQEFNQSKIQHPERTESFLKRLRGRLTPDDDEPQPPFRDDHGFHGALHGPVRIPGAKSILNGLFRALEYFSEVFLALLQMLGIDTGNDDDGGGNIHRGEKLKIEFLHRYSILWTRSRLLRHYHEPKDLVDDGVADHIREDLHAYSNALQDYRLFRTEGHFLFPTDELMNPLAKDIALLDDMRRRLQAPPPDSEEARTLAREADEISEKIGTKLLTAMRVTTSGITRVQQRRRRQDMWARLLMALGGGLALIAPMLIMVLHPSKATALVTTCCFVVAVAIALAIFMRDSKPKDVVACTMAYAAVLVVFVGLGGGNT
ncbi:hypothetical protein B0T18DRAFT_417771 [Schizothecium vesticola]|uniref:DUF6594 domain-containing protein n=1 Tax=Schizothecium vesticola TaxID=314040 RepID=A0AA40EJ87_9PEZI|nr:hypothetical protein B0T18DRAFT_417771 [Schizothecium vesticola]